MTQTELGCQQPCRLVQECTERAGSERVRTEGLVGLLGSAGQTLVGKVGTLQPERDQV